MEAYVFCVIVGKVVKLNCLIGFLGRFIETMGLFGLGTAKGKSGGLMNVIRCDEPEYLVWKWRPEGQNANSTSRENSIRYGSSLRVKDGEVAVFVYRVFYKL